MKKLLWILCCLPVAGYATDEVYTVRIKDHRFIPAEVRIPAGVKVKLVLENQDATPEEFDSHALNREKVIAGNGKSSIYLGPLNAGRYHFAGEFHADTAQGIVIVQ
jgi:plastocyanin